MPRLYHTKSKTGCQRCRSRRVKCDENRPVCSSCLRHGVECTFDRANESITAKDSISRSEPSTTESRGRRLRELNLLHFFLFNTVPSMTSPTIPAMNDTWTVRVPKLAMDYEPLLSAIMLIASHHLARIRTTPEEVEHYLTLRSLYLGTTLQAHRPALSSVTKENAEAVCFTALILSVDNMANLQNRALEPYEPPLQWIQLCRSIEGVWRFALDLVKDDATSRIGPATENMIPWYREARTFSSERLSHLLQPLEGEVINADNMKAYREVAGVLSWILTGIESGESLDIFCRRLRLLPFLLSDQFVILLQNMDSRALVLLAHHFAMTAYAGELWWIGESPIREVKAVKRFVGEVWQGMLSWPLEMVQRREQRNKGAVAHNLDIPA